MRESKLVLFPFADLLIEKRVIVVHCVVGSIVARGGRRGWIIFPLRWIVFPFLGFAVDVAAGKDMAIPWVGIVAGLDPTMSCPKG